MNFGWETFWEVLGRTSIIVGLILAIPVFWTWWQVVFGERRQRRRWIKEISRQPGHRPGVLIIDLLPGRNIEANVKRHLAKDEVLGNIPEDRIAHVKRMDMFKPSDVAEYARELRNVLRRLQDAGVDVIHLFHAGPDVSALIAGAELSNGARVLLYHYEQGEYHTFGPLEPLRSIS
ncbi:MAG: SAVED domain-containing protein [Methylophilaceae bacterium]|nr:SAVED domain-containing protein [Methylophilaceae bacterium]